MELPVVFQHVKQNQIVDDGCLLFIPSKSVSKQKVFLLLFSDTDEVCVLTISLQTPVRM